jgi:tRNA (Thr-GGU) A37 N-methylase
VIFVKGLDAINGTPVLDIKPYIEEVEDNDKENRSDKGLQPGET